MSNPKSEHPDSLETPKAAPEDHSEETTADRATTVVEMSGANRAADASAIDEAEGETSRPGDKSGDDTPDSSPIQNKPSRRLMIVLLALLLVSVGFNILQAQQQRRIAEQSAEIDLALDRAMQRIDQETFRANQAEGALSEIDRNVDNVQERIAELQSALSELSKATTR